MIIGHVNNVFPNICFKSVLILSILYSANGKMADRSRMCTKGRHLDVSLTNSNGFSDSYIILIANHRKLNCSFSFSVNENLHMILVIELPDWRPGWDECGNKSNEILVKGKDFTKNSEVVNICKYLREKSDNIYHVLVKEKIDVKVLSQGGMHSVKITATSARDSNISHCKSDKEIECKKNNHTYCIINVLGCDGNFNCGVKDKFDEDKLMCYGYEQLSWMIVIMIMITTLITILLILAIIRNLLPKEKEILIYQGKQMLTEGFEYPEKRFVVEVETRYLDHAMVQRGIFPVESVKIDDLNNGGAVTKRSSQNLTVRSLEMN